MQYTYKKYYKPITEKKIVKFFFTNLPSFNEVFIHPYNEDIFSKNSLTKTILESRGIYEMYQLNILLKIKKKEKIHDIDLFKKKLMIWNNHYLLIVVYFAKNNNYKKIIPLILKEKPNLHKHIFLFLYYLIR